MRPQSAKAKGRRLQQEIRDDILRVFPELEPDDVRSVSMGAGGEDLLLSPAARRVFPFAVESRNVEAINIWKSIADAVRHNAVMMARGGCGPVTAPLVVFRRNRTPAHAVISWPVLLDLLRRLHDAEKAAAESRSGAHDSASNRLPAAFTSNGY